MKKSLLWILIVSTIAVFSLAGCKTGAGEEEVVEESVEEVTDEPEEEALVRSEAEEIEEEQAKTPIWSITDLEVEKLNGEDIYISIYERTIYERPPFYNGSMPLIFEIGYLPGGLSGNTYSSEKPLFYDFGDFVTYFIYDNGLIVGAQTYDKEGHLIAEVGNIYFYITEKNEQGIEMEEFHYMSGGELVFKCKSQINPYISMKIKETEKIGVKPRDYYFVWPT